MAAATDNSFNTRSHTKLWLQCKKQMQDAVKYTVAMKRCLIYFLTLITINDAVVVTSFKKCLKLC